MSPELAQLRRLMVERNITTAMLLAAPSHKDDTEWQAWIAAFLRGELRLTSASFDHVHWLAQATRTDLADWLRLLPPHFPLRRGVGHHRVRDRVRSWHAPE
jgi:hypothetical protein